MFHVVNKFLQLITARDIKLSYVINRRLLLRFIPPVVNFHCWTNKSFHIDQTSMLVNKYMGQRETVGNKRRDEAASIIRISWCDFHGHWTNCTPYHISYFHHFLEGKTMLRARCHAFEIFSMISAVTLGMLRKGLWLPLHRLTCTSTPATLSLSIIICCTSGKIPLSFSQTIYEVGSSRNASLLTGVDCAEYG